MMGMLKGKCDGKTGLMLGMLLCVTTGEKETEKGWGLNMSECMGSKTQMQGGFELLDSTQ